MSWYKVTRRAGRLHGQDLARAVRHVDRDEGGRSGASTRSRRASASACSDAPGRRGRGSGVSCRGARIGRRPRRAAGGGGPLCSNHQHPRLRAGAAASIRRAPPARAGASCARRRPGPRRRRRPSQPVPRVRRAAVARARFSVRGGAVGSRRRYPRGAAFGPASRPRAGQLGLRRRRHPVRVGGPGTGPAPAGPATGSCTNGRASRCRAPTARPSSAPSRTCTPASALCRASGATPSPAGRDLPSIALRL